MGKTKKRKQGPRLSPEQWQDAEDRYVFGEPITYEGIGLLINCSRVTVIKHAGPQAGNWQVKRDLAHEEVRIAAKARLIEDQTIVEMQREKDSEQRYEDSSSSLNDLLDILLAYFVPKSGADKKEIDACRTQLEALSANQKGALIVRCTERLAGVVKTKQLLNSGATERLLVDLKTSDNIDLDADTEAAIEYALIKAKEFQVSE